MYTLLIPCVIVSTCLLSSFIEGCGMMMPPHAPVEFEQFVTQRRWNELRAEQMRQMANNRLCDGNVQNNEFVCNLKTSTIVTRRGVCSPLTEPIPVCIWKENTGSGSSMDARSSIGYDRENCRPQNQVIVSPAQQAARRQGRHSHHHKAIRERILAISAERNFAVSNNYNLNAEAPEAEIPCSFEETVVTSTEGYCKKLGLNHNKLLPNYGCQHINGTLQIAHEDCSYLRY